MDLSSLQPGHSLDIRPDRELSPADSPFDVASTFAPGQLVASVPDKAIGQRWCKADRLGDTGCAGSDSENIDVHDAGQQKPEPKTDDDDGSWQVVTRRRLRCKRQQPRAAPPGNTGNTGNSRGARAKSASVSRLPRNSSAGTGVTGQKQPPGSDPLAQLSITSCSCWPLCIRSFARLGEVDWVSFQPGLEKFRRHQQLPFTTDDFRRFHHMMAEGPQAIRAAGETVFLVVPFKVLLSDSELFAHTLVSSIVIECMVPGFLRMLGVHFSGALSGVSRSYEELLEAITELFARICQEDEHWLDRLGWQALSVRDQCDLFSSVHFFFKRTSKINLTRSLHQQISGSWFKEHHYATVQRLAGNTASDPDADLGDLSASLRAIYVWLEGRFFLREAAGERHQVICCYADVTESIIDVMGKLGQQPASLLLSIWKPVALWSFHFRKYLSDFLGVNRTIALFKRLLQQIQRWPALENLAFELRLTLLIIALMRCEELLHKRDNTLFFQVWSERENLMRSLLAQCNQFLTRYRPPFRDQNKSILTRRKEAQLNVMLRESSFYRLDCEAHQGDRQRIQKNLEICRNGFKSGWALSRHHREVGAIELAKWCFLAGEDDAGVRSLMSVRFDRARMSRRKAQLLVDYGAYQEGIDEYRHVKALMVDAGEFDQYAQDEIDDRIAAAHYQWFTAGNDTAHLISAYRLSVDVLGRCDIRDRKRFEGGLAHIVNAMKNSGLKFQDFAGQASVLSYLVRDGCGIKSWYHFANLLYIRHKLGLTSTGSVNQVADDVGKQRFFFGLDKQS